MESDFAEEGNFKGKQSPGQQYEFEEMHEEGKILNEKGADQQDQEEDEDDTGHRKSTLQKFSREVFVSRVEIIDFKELGGGKISYVIRIRGRTKYLVNLRELAQIGLISKTQYQQDLKLTQIMINKGEAQSTPLTTQQSVEYCIVKRYSELLTFHKVLQGEMKNWMRKNGFQPTQFPEFPPKKFFFAKTKMFVQQRINDINDYFNTLFKTFPTKVPYTNALIDLCQPLRLSVAVIGAHKSGKSSIIRAFAKLLTEQEDFYRQYIQNKAENPLDAMHGGGSKKMINNRVSADFNFGAFKASEVTADLPYYEEETVVRATSTALDENGQSAPSESGKKKKQVKKMVIKQRRTENGESEEPRGVSGTVTPFEEDEELMRSADSYFPLDVAYQANCGSNLLFRLEIQEYEQPQALQQQMAKQSTASRQTASGDEGDLKNLFAHILANDERNCFIFTYDVTAASTFKLYLKKAIKDLIFAHEEVEESRSSERKKLVCPDGSLPDQSSQMVPFLIVGMKKDKPKDKHKVTREEANNLLTVLRKHMKCDLSTSSAQNPEDIAQTLHNLMGLASSHLFPHYQHLNQCSTNNFGQ